MGFLDKVKEKASEVASDAGRATKVAQAQMKVKSLQGEIEHAKKDLGDVAFDLIEKGELTNVAFDEPLAKIRATQVQIDEKEAEIAALKAEGSAEGTAPGEAAAESRAAEEAVESTAVEDK
jgi:hypothetical protein